MRPGTIQEVEKLFQVLLDAVYRFQANPLPNLLPGLKLGYRPRFILLKVDFTGTGDEVFLVFLPAVVGYVS